MDLMPTRRPGLFGGIANAVKRAGRNFMAIDPQTRMLMGAGMMEGGLPGAARGYVQGGDLAYQRGEREQQQMERQRQAAERTRVEAERAQQQERMNSFRAMLPPEEQAQFDVDPLGFMSRKFAQRDPLRPLTVNPGQTVLETDPVTGRPIIDERTGKPRVLFSLPPVRSGGRSEEYVPRNPNELVFPDSNQ